MTKFYLLLAMAALSLSGCNSSDAEYGSSVPNYDDSAYTAEAEDASETEEDREAFDEDRAREAAEDEIASESYVGLGSPYGCTDDCSGHEAGFRYRAERGYQGYNADSPSFNEGGEAFDDAIEERVEEMQRDYESGEESAY